MKLNNVELKIGQWWVDETQSHLGIYHPFRVMDLWEEKNVWERRANGVSSSTFPQINHAPIWKLYRLATPAELTAAGVPDSQRLVEQRSEWSGVRLWIGDFCTRPAYCWFTIDHGGWRPLDGYVHEGEVTTGKDYIGKYDGGDCVEVTTDPRYAWVYQREDVLQAVVKFRSERREAGLKWCGVCGVIIKSNGSRAEFWNGAKWLETCRIDSGFDTVATPEQIAQSGVPLSDIPDPALRASVASGRGKTTMTAEQLANQIGGREYGNEISRSECQIAKDSGLLVVFGYSDDNVELRGVVNDEISAWEGVEFGVPANGEFETDEDEIRIRKRLIDKGWTPPESERIVCNIKAEWCPKDLDCSWRISTDAPHHTFDIMEDGKLFCRGVVIDFNAAKASPAPSDPTGETK